MTRLFISTLLAAAVAPSLAFAADAYLGATATRGGTLTFVNPVNGKSASADARATYKLYGGYALTDYLAVEGGFAHTGTTHYSRTDLGLAADPTFRMQSYYVAARLTHRFNEDWSVFGKAGVARSRFELTDGAGGSDRVSSSKPLLGVGVAYNVTRAVAATVEFEHVGTTREPGLVIKQNKLQLGVMVGF